MKIVGVIGSDGPIAADVSKAAEEIGAGIAKRGYALLCGGRGGVMEAACRGAKREGGLTIGVLPTLDKSQANKYVDIVVPTSLGYARNALVASAPDVLIAVHGSVGTLSEVAMALNYRKPVILVDSGGIAGELEKINFSKEYAALVRHCTAEDAVEAASKLIR